MRVLIISNEVWNDKINGNNILSNWFEGLNVDIANIYGEPGTPLNKCCKRYFQITDQMMANSLLGSSKAGYRLPILDYSVCSEEIGERKPERLYGILKSISGDAMRLIRELIWLCGKYDESEMEAFIKEFDPDIVFSARMANCKMLRLERVIDRIAGVPMIAFTGDDEYSLRQLSFSPFFWINRFLIRKMLRKNVSRYSLYYSLSEDQIAEYENEFNCTCKILRKCGTFEDRSHHKKVNQSIKLIYAGKLYCNRWKPLTEIASCIKEINQEYGGIRISLDIYTSDNLTHKQNRLLNDGIHSTIHPFVDQNTLKRLFGQYDIALHVESTDLKNKLLTRLSFSTKIIDCIFSGCAVMAYCWNQQTGWKYLKKEDAAICVSNKEELMKSLKQICRNPSLIEEYKGKAKKCGEKNHRKSVIQKKILKDFDSIVREFE